MHKSVLTFCLLASLLVMLAIMPFLNQSNSFLLNTVMAQEYDRDPYERYAMGDMVANEYESYRDNYNHEADPNYYYPSSYNEDYRSYPSDDNYDKSHDKSNSITENNCINVNNINSGSASGELVKAVAGATAGAGIEEVEEENSGERHSDNGYNNNKKGSDFDCIINNNNNVGIGEEGNGVGHVFCILESLEGCFQQHVEESKLEIIKLAFDAGVEFSTYVYGRDLIPQQVTFSSFEDI